MKTCKYCYFINASLYDSNENEIYTIMLYLDRYIILKKKTTLAYNHHPIVYKLVLHFGSRAEKTNAPRA